LMGHAGLLRVDVLVRRGSAIAPPFEIR